MGKSYPPALGVWILNDAHGQDSHRTLKRPRTATSAGDDRRNARVSTWAKVSSAVGTKRTAFHLRAVCRWIIRRVSPVVPGHRRHTEMQGENTARRENRRKSVDCHFMDSVSVPLRNYPLPGTRSFCLTYPYSPVYGNQTWYHVSPMIPMTFIVF